MMTTIKRMLPLLALTAAMLLSSGCSGAGSGNYPKEPDTPEPPAHEGTFRSEHGSMRFPGDGESIVICFDKELAELSGLPEGECEGTYVFLSGDLPPHKSFPVRYDIAHEMEITAGGQTAVITAGLASEDGKTAQVGRNMVTPERIPLLFLTEGKNVSILFEKTEEEPTAETGETGG